MFDKLKKNIVFAMAVAGVVVSSQAIANMEKDQEVFDRVISKLDTGGNFLMIFNAEDVAKKILPTIEEFWTTLTKDAPLNDPDFRMANNIYNLMFDMAADSGLTEFNAIGLSSKLQEDGMFINKTVVDRDFNPQPGFLWEVMGTENKPIESIKLFPQNTVMASYGHFDFYLLFDWVTNHIRAQEDFPELAEAMDEIFEEAMRDAGIIIPEIFASLNGEVAMIVSMDGGGKKLHLEGVDIPVGAIAFVLGSTGDELFELLSMAMTMLPDVVAGDRDDGFSYRTYVLDGAYPFSPTVAKFGDYIVVSTTAELAEDIFNVNMLDAANLFATVEYQQMVAGLPKVGVGMSYLDPKLALSYREFIESIMKVERVEPEIQSLVGKWLDFTLGKNGHGGAAVSVIDENGVYSCGRSSQSMRSLVILPAVFPLALFSIIDVLEDSSFFY